MSTIESAVAAAWWVERLRAAVDAHNRETSGRSRPLTITEEQAARAVIRLGHYFDRIQPTADPTSTSAPMQRVVSNEELSPTRHELNEGLRQAGIDGAWMMDLVSEDAKTIITPGHVSAVINGETTNLDPRIGDLAREGTDDRFLELVINDGSSLSGYHLPPSGFGHDVSRIQLVGYREHHPDWFWLWKSREWVKRYCHGVTAFVRDESFRLTVIEGEDDRLYFADQIRDGDKRLPFDAWVPPAWWAGTGEISQDGQTVGVFSGHIYPGYTGNVTCLTALASVDPTTIPVASMVERWLDCEGAHWLSQGDGTIVQLHAPPLLVRYPRNSANLSPNFYGANADPADWGELVWRDAAGAIHRRPISEMQAAVIAREGPRHRGPVDVPTSGFLPTMIRDAWAAAFPKAAWDRALTIHWNAEAAGNLADPRVRALEEEACELLERAAPHLHEGNARAAVVRALVEWRLDLDQPGLAARAALDFDVRYSDDHHPAVGALARRLADRGQLAAADHLLGGLSGSPKWSTQYPALQQQADVQERMGHGQAARELREAAQAITEFALLAAAVDAGAYGVTTSSNPAGANHSKRAAGDGHNGVSAPSSGEIE